MEAPAPAGWKARNRLKERHVRAGKKAQDLRSCSEWRQFLPKGILMGHNCLGRSLGGKGWGCLLAAL